MRARKEFDGWIGGGAIAGNNSGKLDLIAFVSES